MIDGGYNEPSPFPNNIKFKHTSQKKRKINKKFTYNLIHFEYRVLLHWEFTKTGLTESKTKKREWTHLINK